MHSLPHRNLARRETVGHGYEADDVCTVTNASTTTTRQNQESTRDAHQKVNLRVQTTEAESADPSKARHEQRGQAATALRPRDGAVHHVLVTLAVRLPTAEAAVAAPIKGADHLRQGGIVPDVTTSPNRTDLGGVGATVPTAVLTGQIAADPQRGLTRTETQMHWDELKMLRIRE